MHQYLIGNELGYTNHRNGKYITEEEATHIVEMVDGKPIVKEIQRESLEDLL